MIKRQRTVDGGVTCRVLLKVSVKIKNKLKYIFISRGVVVVVVDSHVQRIILAT